MKNEHHDLLKNIPRFLFELSMYSTHERENVVETAGHGILYK
jgi:hypothetical protein